MASELIDITAKAISENSILENWKFFGAIAALSIISSFVGSTLSSYFKKRGEFLATKADMKEVLIQMQNTTRATEEVKVAVSHADWMSREWRTLRRTKLEELLANVYEIENWIEIERSRWLFDEVKSYDRLPLDKLNVLTLLYFPELKSEVGQLRLSYLDVYLLILEYSVLLRGLKIDKDFVGVKKELDNFKIKYQPLLVVSKQNVSALENKILESLIDSINKHK